MTCEDAGVEPCSYCSMGMECLLDEYKESIVSSVANSDVRGLFEFVLKYNYKNLDRAEHIMMLRRAVKQYAPEHLDTLEKMLILQ